MEGLCAIKGHGIWQLNTGKLQALLMVGTSFSSSALFREPFTLCSLIESNISTLNPLLKAWPLPRFFYWFNGLGILE